LESRPEKGKGQELADQGTSLANLKRVSACFLHLDVPSFIIGNLRHEGILAGLNLLQALSAFSRPSYNTEAKSLHLPVYLKYPSAPFIPIL